ncbi:MAG: HAD-IC family P-type ATPase [Parcubacteria group bacterium]|nr:HAD-IC family P-type ATPase [Parcubacteria group bacterium]
MAFAPYTIKTAKEVFEDFYTSPEGLTSKEVSAREKQWGKNEFISAKIVFWKIFLRQFRSSFVHLLIIASALALLLKEYIDSVWILLFVLINAVLGFYQEYRSEKTVQLLQKYVKSFAKVRRDGKEMLADSKELVPGDIVSLQIGDQIPADVRLIAAQNLTVDESVLTGESVPISKIDKPLEREAAQIHQAQNLGFLGTMVVGGSGEGVVIATGGNTAVGRIRELAGSSVRESSFEKEIRKLSQFILWLVVLTLFFVLAINIFLVQSPVPIPDLLIFAIALAVSVIPEALPVVMTFCLSTGALRLAKNKVVVKRLSAIEDLGSIEVLCTDKTGTLTQNHLTVDEVYPNGVPEAALYGSLAGSAINHKTSNNAFDMAIWQYLSPEDRQKIKQYHRGHNIPFDPTRRRASVIVSKDGQHFLIVRGAPESVVGACAHLGKEKKESLLQWAGKRGQEGRRVVAVGIKPLASDRPYAHHDESWGLRFIGFITFTDPLKPDALAAITHAEHLGVQIKVLTGDSAEVAGAVGSQLKLIDKPNQVLTGEAFDKLSYQEKLKAVENYAVFARVAPSQKYQIIQLLQEKRYVGFLGEGINDAPGLKIANVGLVVSGAADIAREAADIVLLKRGLKVIIEGIKEGRGVFANTLKYIKATLSSNFGNFYAIAVASFLIDYLPLLPLQILLVNLLSDFPMIAVATDKVGKEEVTKPTHYDIKEIALVGIILGVVSSIFDFIVFGLFYREAPEVLRTNWFIASILTELVFLFSIRSRLVFFKAARPSWPLVGISLLAAGLTVGIPMSQLGKEWFAFIAPTAPHLGLILLVCLLYFIVTECSKLLYYRFMKH